MKQKIVSEERVLRLNLDDVGPLPEIAAVYAIFEQRQGNFPETVCRYIGITGNIKQHIAKHGSLLEINVKLRYFILSNKPKIIRYIPVSHMTESEQKKLYFYWLTLFNPDCNIPLNS